MSKNGWPISKETRRCSSASALCRPLSLRPSLSQGSPRRELGPEPGRGRCARVAASVLQGGVKGRGEEEEMEEASSPQEEEEEQKEEEEEEELVISGAGAPHTHTHARARARAHTHTHTYTGRHTHTLTHCHTHTVQEGSRACAPEAAPSKALGM
jgi:hypothetical protein